MPVRCRRSALPMGWIEASRRRPRSGTGGTVEKTETPTALDDRQLRGAMSSAVYAGRPRIRGNPLVIGMDGPRAHVLAKCEIRLRNNPDT